MNDLDKLDIVMYHARLETAAAFSCVVPDKQLTADDVLQTIYNLPQQLQLSQQQRVLHGRQHLS